MIYILVWLFGGMALAALYGAGRAHLRADEAFDLAWDGMNAHHYVAETLEEHHGRLNFIQGVPTANDDSYGETGDDSYGGTDSE